MLPRRLRFPLLHRFFSTPRGVYPAIAAELDSLTAIRRDIHKHPELGYEETRTAALIVENLRSFGVDEVHEGLAVTGVVGTIRGRDGAAAAASPGTSSTSTSIRTLGLRADMDALPLQEVISGCESAGAGGAAVACSCSQECEPSIDANATPRGVRTTHDLHDKHTHDFHHRTTPLRTGAPWTARCTRAGTTGT